MQTPPAPSLITNSNSSQKLSNGTPFHRLSSSNMPPLRPKLPSGSQSSHKIITIGDSPITKNPPPLLPTPSTGLTGVQSHAPHYCYWLSFTNRTPSIQRLVLLLSPPFFLSSKKTEIIILCVHNESNNDNPLINNAPINVLPQVPPHGQEWGRWPIYMKSIASPLERILGSNAPIIGLYFPPIVCKYWSNPPDPGYVYRSNTIKSLWHVYRSNTINVWGNTLIGA